MCARESIESVLIDLKSAELLDVLHARLQYQASHTPVNAKHFKMSTATAEEVKRGIAVKPDTRTVDQSSSSTDLKPTTEDTSLRAPATSHPLEPDAEEKVSRKARVARNVLHISGEDELKFNVNEEAWPNAGLAIRSNYEP